MNSLLKDVRYAARGLFRRPVFTAMIVLSLALGIGANTAIFSVVNALLFKPLPYPEADRLQAITFDNGKFNGYQFWPYPKYTAFRDTQSSFESVAAYAQLQLTIASDQPRKVEAEIVTPNYFPLLGLKPSIGNFFPAEFESEQLLLLSHRMWHRDFGGDTQVVGRSILVNRESFVIAGVLPPDFRGQSGTVECWVPMGTADRLRFKSALSSNGAWWLKVVGRLKPGISAQQAAAEMPIVSDRVAQLSPAQVATMLTPAGKELIKPVPLKDTKVDPAVRKSFLILQGVVALLLAIACANTANLLLARSISRHKEFAIRLAIGGSRARLLRLVLVESVLFALLGGTAGLLFATWIIQWLNSARPLNTVGFWSQYAQTFGYFSVTLDWSLLFFNFALALVVGLIFGLAPAWRASKPRLNEVLKREQWRDAGLRSLRKVNLRGGLVVVEIALAIILLAGAGLLLKSFARLSAQKLGFDPSGVITTAVDADRRPLEFYEQLLERVQALPGVEKASLSLTTPLSGDHNGGNLQFEGQTVDASEKNLADFNVVTPDYFETMRIALLKGRQLRATDRIGSTRVAVINHELASRFWPGLNPLGKRFKTPFRDSYGEDNSWIEVVGVVEDAKYGGADEPAEPTLYLPAWQPLGTPQAVFYSPSTITIRTSSEERALFAAIRREVGQLDKSVVLSDSTTMRDRVDRVTARYRHSAFFVSLFALVAVVLSVTGIYGVVSYTVSSGTREVGIRMALGAQRTEIFKLVAGSILIIVIISLFLGLAASFAATKVLASQLYQTSVNDPFTFIGVGFLIVVVALAGSFVPAWRASRISPMSALRDE